MKNRKSKILIFVLFLALIITPYAVFAQLTGESGPIFDNPLRAETITDLLTDVLDIVVQVGLVVIVFFIIFAGFQFVTAGGNETKLINARKAIVATLIGSAIVLGSYAIATALKNTVDQLKAGTGVSQLEVINFKV